MILIKNRETLEQSIRTASASNNAELFLGDILSEEEIVALIDNIIANAIEGDIGNI